MSSEAPKSEQIQANVAAALSRLRGDLSSSSVASAVISVPAPNAAPEPAPADPLQVGMPEIPRHVSDAILQADPAMASPSSERRLREPEVEKTTPYQRLAGLQIEQPDLLSGVANTPPPLPDLSDNEAAGAVYARRRRNRLVLMGSVAAVVVLGALWMFMSGGSDEVVAPPVITADATPEKVKPEDEGGMQVQNLNTTILDQSQTQQGGETVMPPPETPVAPPAPAATADAQPDAMQATDVPSVPAPAAPDAPSVAAPDTAAAPVVTPTPAPAPTPEPAATVAATPTPEPTPAPAPEPAPAAQTTTPEPAALQTAAAPVEVPAGSVRIQFAAVKTEAAAADVWAKLQKKYPAVLGGLGLNVEKVDKAGSVLYRVQAGPFADKAAAKQACVKLKAQKQDCIVAR